MISAQTLRVCREGKPAPTFPDPALSRDRSRDTVIDQRDRVAQHVNAGARPDAVLGEVTAERARTGHAMKRAD